MREAFVDAIVADTDPDADGRIRTAGGSEPRVERAPRRETQLCNQAARCRGHDRGTRQAGRIVNGHRERLLGWTFLGGGQLPDQIDRGGTGR